MLTRFLAEDIVSAEPSSSGLPGGEFITQGLNWLLIGALWGSLASLLAGALLWGLGQMSGNAQGASRGKTLVVAGLVGALLAGMSVSLVNQLWTIGQDSAGAVDSGTGG